MRIPVLFYASISGPSQDSQTVHIFKRRVMMPIQPMNGMRITLRVGKRNWPFLVESIEWEEQNTPGIKEPELKVVFVDFGFDPKLIEEFRTDKNWLIALD